MKLDVGRPGIAAGDPEAGDRGIGHTSKGAPRPRRIDRRSWRLYLPGHGHALGVACQVVGVVANREARVDRRGVGLVEADHSDEQLAALTWRDAPRLQRGDRTRGCDAVFDVERGARDTPERLDCDRRKAVGAEACRERVGGRGRRVSAIPKLASGIGGPLPVRSTASRHFRRRCRRTSGCRQRMRRPLPR